ncbi:hypothetical protein J008_02548 [Cryptococcus neoformans]|nr:hypothetical protein J008_02548 [Cryptococcus neoformans var. grubii]
MSREDQAIRKIEKGRLDGSSQDIDTIPDVLNQLRNEHPTGPANPFNHPNPPGRAMPTLTPDQLWKIISLMNPDTASDISGWNPPPHESGLQGKEMFLASSLVPLHKPDGSVCPHGSRRPHLGLCKGHSQSHLQSEFLPPFQMGVMTSGGVEPIVRAVERAIEGYIGRPPHPPFLSRRI